MRRTLALLALAAALAALAACNNGGVTIVSPDQATTTDIFSATVAAGGTNSFSFTTKAAGTVTLTLTSDARADLTAIPLLIGVGTPGSNGACIVPTGAQAVLQTGTTTASVSITTAGFGSFCLMVTDVTNVGPASYTIQVMHP